MATGGDNLHGDKIEGNKVDVSTITTSYNISIASTDRIFLRKVGSGYIFIHRMLMEHFARWLNIGLLDQGDIRATGVLGE